MNPSISRIIRDQYLRQSDKWDAGNIGAIMSTPPPTDSLCRDCNALEDALADSQTAVKLLKDQVSQLKSEASTSVKQDAHEHAVRYAEQAKAERDAAIARAEKAERGFKNLRDGSGWQDEHDRAEKLAGLLREARERLHGWTLVAEHHGFGIEQTAKTINEIDAALAERGEVGR